MIGFMALFCAKKEDMKRIVTGIILVSFAFLTNAQQVQWAHKLIRYSSDLGGKQNGIKRILGKPDAFPQCGNSANAWSPKNALDGREVVIVGFEKAQTVKQIAIFENLNAGCVNRVYVSSDGESFNAVWGRKSDYKTPVYKATLSADRSYYFGRRRRKIQEVPQAVNPGIERIFLDTPASNVVAVKIEFVFALVPGQKQIDAIGVSDGVTPLEATINTNPELEKLPKAQTISLGDLEPYSPIIAPDGKLVFSASKDKEVIYTSTSLGNNQWSSPEMNVPLSQNETYNYVEHFSDTFLLRGGALYSKGSGESGYEWLTFKEGKIEEKPLKITAFNNYNDTSDATITADGTTLILAIETDFTNGSSDLYMTTQKEDGTFGFLQNMGKICNSAAEEATPQLLSDTKTLLFASNGFSGFGDYDIYITYRLDATWKNWSEPINLGSKVNSSKTDIQPFYDEKTETLFYVSAINDTMQMQSIAIPKTSLLSKNTN